MTTAPSPLSVQRIQDAAIALADEHGLGALSMRRLGATLGVEAMSLYRYVPSKNALLDLLADAIVGTWTVPPHQDWHVTVATVMHRGNAVLLTHPWAVELLSSRPYVGHGRLRYAETLTSALLDAGFSPTLAHHALHIVDGTIIGFSAQEVRRPGTQSMGDNVERLLDGALKADYPGISMTITEPHDHDAEYALMVDLVIDGLDRLRDGGTLPSFTPSQPATR